MDQPQTRRDFLCAGAGTLVLPSVLQSVPRHEDVPASFPCDESWMRVSRTIKTDVAAGIRGHKRSHAFQLFAFTYIRPAVWNEEARTYISARHATFEAIVDRVSAALWLDDIEWPQRIFTTRMDIDLGRRGTDDMDFQVFGARFNHRAEDVLTADGVSAKKLHFICANSTILTPTGRTTISDPGFRHDHGTA